MTKRKPLGEFLSRAMAAGRSQADIARELGVSRSTVHLWATGKRQPPERFRTSLRAMAQPGWKVPTAPKRTTRSGKPAKTAGSVTVTPLPSGSEHVFTHSRTAFARELDRLLAEGRAPSVFTVLLHGFRSDLYRDRNDAPRGPRTRRLQVHMSPEEARALASGQKGAWNSAITRSIQARNYEGGFTFDRATSLSMDSTP
ncbi:helix-turn-helix domain-containing protein [Nocardia flavorosea]|uniref:Helix-turn-helix domain-containing protein n=1 Tax=Nocardia flavorosea TaxID=53429 RepID=A0A846YVG7_9NOCA|nr:helix-turn-helix domain-containing protein [Nocardia flavorosea]NKY60999.1 helix-turn-helix domain-containing protein [Nocardia flavorosea]